MITDNKIYKNTEFPCKERTAPGKEFHFSVDVITYNDDEDLNISYYDYKKKKWYHHTDNKPIEETAEFVWIYKPENLKIQ